MINLNSFFTLPIRDWRQLRYQIVSYRVFWWTLRLSRLLGVLLPWPLWVMETRCGGGGLVWVGYDQRVFPNVGGFLWKLEEPQVDELFLGLVEVVEGLQGSALWTTIQDRVKVLKISWFEDADMFTNIDTHDTPYRTDRSKAKHADPKFWWGSPLVGLENLKLSVV